MPDTVHHAAHHRLLSALQGRQGRVVPGAGIRGRGRLVPGGGGVLREVVPVLCEEEERGMNGLIWYRLAELENWFFGSFRGKP